MRDNLKYFSVLSLAVYLLLFNLLPAGYHFIQLVKNNVSNEINTYDFLAEADAETKEKETKPFKSYEEVEGFIVIDFFFSYLHLNESSLRYISQNEKLQVCFLKITTPPPNLF